MAKVNVCGDLIPTFAIPFVKYPSLGMKFQTFPVFRKFREFPYAGHPLILRFQVGLSVAY